MPRLIFSRKIAELYHAYVFINVDIMLRDTNHDARSNIRMRSLRLMISLDYDKSGLMKTSCGKKRYFFPRVILSGTILHVIRLYLTRTIDFMVFSEKNFAF